jgi:hypothetical protein
MRTFARRVLVPVLLLGLLFSSSCSDTPPFTGIRRYALSGEVLILIPGSKRAVVKHGQIDGWMGATTLEYPVKETADWAKLHVGDQITGTVFVQDPEYWLADIVVQHSSSK